MICRNNKQVVLGYYVFNIFTKAVITKQREFAYDKLIVAQC